MVVRIDLKDPRVSVHVARGGPDPDGDGPWLTTLMPTSEIAEREKYDVAINGDFFEAQATKDIEGKDTGYVRGKAAAPVGMVAMTDGVLWHRDQKPRPFLEITSSNIARLENGGSSEPMDATARVDGGRWSQIIVRNSHSVTFHQRLRDGATSADGGGHRCRSGTQLTLLVV